MSTATRRYPDITPAMVRLDARIKKLDAEIHRLHEHREKLHRKLTKMLLPDSCPACAAKSRL